MPSREWYALGLSIDWSMAIDDVMKEMVPQWFAKAAVEEKGLFGS